MREPSTTFRGITAGLLAAFALFAAACGTDTDGATDPVGDDESSDDTTAPGSDDAADGEAHLADEVAAAVDDLADTADLDPADIEVVTTELVTWRDGSLGCPEPDQAYTQALVDGYRIVLRAEGTEYAYHGEEGGTPFHCDDPQEPAD